mmetsp:Transcript_58909/g.137673  ORF Transcript_58909/g.137673 Transcript_58909/m.137673 type:complete len:435 (+) Transcript_58909:109-1413(+)
MSLEMSVESPPSEKDVLQMAAEVQKMLDIVDLICDEGVKANEKRQALSFLSIAMQPHHLCAEVKRVFVQHSIERRVIEQAVALIECGSSEIAEAACDFLGDFIFNSDVGGRAVLHVFSRLVAAFTKTYSKQAHTHTPIMRSFICLCANIVATCPSGHSHVLPLVSSIFLPLIRDREVPDGVLGSTVLLLANLAVLASDELRMLCAVDVLLELVLNHHATGRRKSVAESVIIFLQGHRQCEEMGLLLSLDTVRDYCIPILDCALKGKGFRGMYPHLHYSVRLFHTLANTREYAEVLVQEPAVVPLLWKATAPRSQRLRLESDDEGRSLAIQALLRLYRFALLSDALPDASSEWQPSGKVQDCVGQLLADDDARVRASAASMWAFHNQQHVVNLFMVGGRLEAAGSLTENLWTREVLSWICPSLAATRQQVAIMAM